LVQPPQSPGDHLADRARLHLAVVGGEALFLDALSQLL
jgi:hypothetical protein